MNDADIEQAELEASAEDARDDRHAKYPLAPKHLLESIDNYAGLRYPVGGFLTAVLENNLSEAFGRADEASQAGLFDIVRYVRWEIPATSHGSREKVEAWLTQEGA